MKQAIADKEKNENAAAAQQQELQKKTDQMHKELYDQLLYYRHRSSGCTSFVLLRSYNIEYKAYSYNNKVNYERTHLGDSEHVYDVEMNMPDVPSVNEPTFIQRLTGTVGFPAQPNFRVIFGFCFVCIVQASNCYI